MINLPTDVIAFFLDYDLGYHDAIYLVFDNGEYLAYETPGSGMYQDVLDALTARRIPLIASILV